MKATRSKVSAWLGVVALTVVGLGAASAPAGAVTTSGKVTFESCDVRTDADLPSTRVGSKFAWSPSLALTHPSPVRVNSDHRMGFTLGDFPAGKIPVGALTDVQVHLRLGFEHDGGATTTLHQSWYRDAHAGTGAIALGEAEGDVQTPSESQFQSWAPVTIDFAFYGTAAGDESVSYFVQCEPIVSPRSMLTVAVFDPDAAATVELGQAKAKQGAAVRVVAKDFAPGENVSAYVGKTKVATFRADDIGGLAELVRVPAAAKKGTQDVRLIGSAKGETATAPLQVTLVKAKAKLAKKSVKRGKKIALTGSKFVAKEKVRVTFKATKTTSKGKKQLKVTIKANAAGKISKKIKLPKKLAKGSYKVTVKGAKSARTAKALKLKIG